MILVFNYRILEHFAFGGEHALGMELYAVDVVFLMFQGHNLSFVTLGCDFQTVGEVLLRLTTHEW